LFAWLASLRADARLLSLLLVSALAVSLEAAEAPRLELDADRRLVLTGLPPILADDGVKEHLSTGLTTSFYFRPGGKQPGGARVDVRYDPWDEVFHLVAAGHGERLRQADVASFAELVEWWQGLRLALLESDRLERPWPRRLKVTVDVVPFSASEQDDARRWLSESIEQGRKSGTDEVGRSGDAAADTLSRTFNLLLATSIRRRALASYAWSPSLPPEAPP
jgi:hypothetical protein